MDANATATSQVVTTTTLSTTPPAPPATSTPPAATTPSPTASTPTPTTTTTPTPPTTPTTTTPTTTATPPTTTPTTPTTTPPTTTPPTTTPPTTTTTTPTTTTPTTTTPTTPTTTPTPTPTPTTTTPPTTTTTTTPTPTPTTTTPPTTTTTLSPTTHFATSTHSPTDTTSTTTILATTSTSHSSTTTLTSITSHSSAALYTTAATSSPGIGVAVIAPVVVVVILLIIAGVGVLVFCVLRRHRPRPLYQKWCRVTAERNHHRDHLRQQQIANPAFDGDDVEAADAHRPSFDFGHIDIEEDLKIRDSKNVSKQRSSHEVRTGDVDPTLQKPSEIKPDNQPKKNDDGSELKRVGDFKSEEGLRFSKHGASRDLQTKDPESKDPQSKDRRSKEHQSKERAEVAVHTEKTVKQDNPSSQKAREHSAARSPPESNDYYSAPPNHGSAFAPFYPDREDLTRPPQEENLYQNRDELSATAAEFYSNVEHYVNPLQAGTKFGEEHYTHHTYQSSTGLAGETFTRTLPVSNTGEKFTRMMPMSNPSEEFTRTLPVSNKGETFTRTLPLSNTGEVFTRSLPLSNPSETFTRTLPASNTGEKFTRTLPVSNYSASQKAGRGKYEDDEHIYNREIIPDDRASHVYDLLPSGREPVYGNLAPTCIDQGNDKILSGGRGTETDVEPTRPFRERAEVVASRGTLEPDDPEQLYDSPPPRKDEPKRSEPFSNAPGDVESVQPSENLPPPRPHKVAVQNYINLPDGQSLTPSDPPGRPPPRQHRADPQHRLTPPTRLPPPPPEDEDIYQNSDVSATAPSVQRYDPLQPGTHQELGGELHTPHRPPYYLASKADDDSASNFLKQPQLGGASVGAYHQTGSSHERARTSGEAAHHNRERDPDRDHQDLAELDPASCDDPSLYFRDDPPEFMYDTPKNNSSLPSALGMSWKEPGAYHIPGVDDEAVWGSSNSLAGTRKS